MSDTEIKEHYQQAQTLTELGWEYGSHKEGVVVHMRTGENRPCHTLVWYFMMGFRWSLGHEALVARLNKAALNPSLTPGLKSLP